MASAVVCTLGGASIATLDRAVYDHWLRTRAAIPASRQFVVIVRDPASEARFGSGPWDRAVLARLITGVARSGAAVVGVDVRPGQPAGPGRGGPVGDALLSEATSTAGTVIYPVASEQARSPADAATSPPGLAEHAKAVGHVVVSPDPDGVVRKVRLFVSVDDRAVPAFGLVLAAAFLDAEPGGVTIDGTELVLRRPAERGGPVRMPVDREGRLLLRFGGPGLPRGVQVVPVSEVWASIDDRRMDTLPALVEDRLVLILTEPPREEHPTPVGSMSDVAIQAQLANALLTHTGLREMTFLWAVVEALVPAGLAAWLWLVLPWWAALMGLVVAATALTGAVPMALSGAGLLLPLSLPLGALVIASATGLVLTHFLSVYRLRRLERENARVRETLVSHESAVESLEDDLDAARAAVARSTGAQRDLAHAAEALRSQLAEARAHEEDTRRQLAELERELRRLRPAEVRSEPTDAADARARQECEAVGIITRDPGMLTLFQDLRKAARGALPILIVGEPGAGKELFARAAHRLSPRATQPFVAVNMAAIPPELFESALFGHVRGSFTGAVGDRKGHFAEADGGTIFLDEIGELRLEHQGKLLRVLQDQTFHRVGASRPTAVDVRVVAASNRNLERGATEGWFREDLYFRLKGVVLRLPPLRERAGDVPLLAARVFASAVGEAGRPGLTLSEEAVAALASHDWPGNVRELENVLRQAVALADGPAVTAKDLRLGPRPRTPVRDSVEPEPEPTSDGAVLASLRQHRFDMQATARALGWDRSTVTQRLKGLGFRALVESGGDRPRAALALAGDPALARTVELKLREYHEHLFRAVESADSADAAVAACRRRFKNLPERHFRFLERLVRERFERR